MRFPLYLPPARARLTGARDRLNEPNPSKMVTIHFKPTKTQIAGGYLVLPQKLRGANDYAIDWKRFTAVALGDAHVDRAMDECNCIRVKTKGLVEPGQTVRASVHGNAVRIEVVQ